MESEFDLEKTGGDTGVSHRDELPNPENDPELEQDFREWAKWLLDVYLWRLEHGQQPDKDHPSG